VIRLTSLVQRKLGYLATKTQGWNWKRDKIDKKNPHDSTLCLTRVSHVYDVATNSPPSCIMYLSSKYGEYNEFLSLISEKIEWESPPSILITKNPNWSQRLGTGTGCVKEMY